VYVDLQFSEIVKNSDTSFSIYAFTFGEYSPLIIENVIYYTSPCNCYEKKPKNAQNFGVRFFNNSRI